jgi:hypothetical protein
MKCVVASHPNLSSFLLLLLLLLLTFGLLVAHLILMLAMILNL